jgi:carbamoyltransferase
MLICGIKLSHDAGIALIEDNRLLFSIEIEKLANNPRYSSMGDLGRVAELLEAEGVTPADVDQFVVDGWFVAGVDDAEVQDTASMWARGGGELGIPVAPYQDRPGASEPLTRYSFHDHDFSPSADGYASYHHVANHLIGGYSSSPFAARGEDALVLVWDGGTVPRLYEVTARNHAVRAVASVLPLTGDIFGEFSSRFEPFYTNVGGFSADQVMRHHLSVAGKAMAYAALGRVEESAFSVFDDLLAGLPGSSPENAMVFSEKTAADRAQILPGLTDADLIATFQAYLGDLLLRKLSELPGVEGRNLVLAGGCALNIKWNSQLRASGLFADVWAPPFPNDSGAAIGTASCEMFRRGDHLGLNWDVYGGPLLATGDVPASWQVRPCSESQVAELLCTTGEPVVVLSGRAELGPRALGNRSILAPATDPAMKDRLNGMKGRAGYRPVAPICLTSRAAEVFSPGSSDPYMLFEHRPRPDWTGRIPAVLHLDGTARLQTIDESAGIPAARILAAYADLSGIPVLCNTSANFNGSGFFPDVASAARWGGTRYIWSDGRLYTQPAA